METLKYSSDPNNLLHLECFPAVRVDSGKYKLEQQYKVQLGSKEIGVVQCVRSQDILLRHITDSLSLTITGKEAAYMKAVLKKMYPNTDWYRQKICYMHFKWVERFQNAVITEHVPKQIAVQTSLGLTARSYSSHA
ncbi:hypothetical protein [Pontibacter sp. SGAir0037]|uniref:hypothetical protein n=1 Tax=Pontibacter sp. SGAir0037 TaxID=2571030 RepID=UPI0010CD2BEA|nr:hypothetical protein [Pontibacter sp. SGAir0037]QCR23103.1 hypothetical protein C1N53_12595 [Pontibacter sp. SGAir0037]